MVEATEDGIDEITSIYEDVTIHPDPSYYRQMQQKAHDEMQKQFIENHDVKVADNPENIFKILSPLGEGAYGMIYKALDKRQNTLVAIRIVNTVDTSSGNLVINQSPKMNYKYIVNYKEFFSWDNNIWMIMDLCVGSVLDFIKLTEKNLTEQQVKVIVKDSLMGLKYFHSQNMVHKNIKAGNILIYHQSPMHSKYNKPEILVNGYIRAQNKMYNIHIPEDLIEFIILFYTMNCWAKIADSSEYDPDGNSCLIPTPYWLAPELFGRNPKDGISTKQDIWALGITIFEMLTGKPPHADKPPLQVIYLIPKSETPVLPLNDKGFEISDELRDFVSLCLTKDRDKRPSAEELLQHEWMKNCRDSVSYEWVKDVIPLLEIWRKPMMDIEMHDGDYDYGSGAEDGCGYSGAMLRGYDNLDSGGNYEHD